MKFNTKKIIDKIISLIYCIFSFICICIFIQIFIIASFNIPTNSMYPELIPGDNILVFKPFIGARIFNIYSTLEHKQVKIFRAPGIKKIKRNDILVFNNPYPNNWNKIEMHILKYFIKRCIAIPKDTLYIQNGVYRINHSNFSVGNIQSQKVISGLNKDSLSKEEYYSFPFDSIIRWNIKNFGPLYIPGKGDTVTLDRTNFQLYKKLIEWEQQGDLQYRDSTVYLNANPIKSYCFQNDDYFLAGDNVINSQDSRYWGLLPEEYIVGKACIIWKSFEPYTNKFRWERFFKVIH